MTISNIIVRLCLAYIWLYTFEARRTIMNVFEICSSRFRIQRKPIIIGDVKNVISITKAMVSFKVVSLLQFFYKQPVYKQLALGWQIA